MLHTHLTQGMGERVMPEPRWGRDPGWPDPNGKPHLHCVVTLQEWKMLSGGSQGQALRDCGGVRRGRVQGWCWTHCGQATWLKPFHPVLPLLAPRQPRVTPTTTLPSSPLDISSRRTYRDPFLL